MKKSILFLVVLALFSCKKEKHEPDRNLKFIVTCTDCSARVNNKYTSNTVNIKGSGEVPFLIKWDFKDIDLNIQNNSEDLNLEVLLDGKKVNETEFEEDGRHVTIFLNL